MWKYLHKCTMRLSIYMFFLIQLLTISGVPFCCQQTRNLPPLLLYILDALNIFFLIAAFVLPPPPSSELSDLQISLFLLIFTNSLSIFFRKVNYRNYNNFIEPITITSSLSIATLTHFFQQRKFRYQSLLFTFCSWSVPSC